MVILGKSIIQQQHVSFSSWLVDWKSISKVGEEKENKHDDVLGLL